MNTKILIVDDEPAIGKLLTYQLRGCNYAVSYVSDGLSALERIEREQPDLVLLDVMMPTLSGWEVCRQIRAYSSIPVIMLTAKSSDADIITGLSSGADDYISKPFNMAHLQARIEAVLRRTQASPRPRTVGTSALKSRPAPPPAPAAPPLPPPAVELPPTLDLSDLPLPAAAASSPAAQAKRVGLQLRDARLAKGIPLIQAARDCSTRWEFLQAIEQENFAYVPKQQLRSALQRYSRYLGIDIQQHLPPAPPRRPWSMLQYATLFTIILLAIAVGVYFL